MKQVRILCAMLNLEGGHRANSELEFEEDLDREESADGTSSSW